MNVDDVNMAEVYEEFFRRANGSKAFSNYCSGVFGVDLTQDGFADKAQLDYMMNFLHFNENDRGLDIGCGNGRIAAYIARESGASMRGLDTSPSAIAYARDRATESPRLAYELGNINDLDVPDRAYSVAILVDSLYFSDDYEKTLGYLHQRLGPGGRIGVFYSEFVHEPSERTRKIPIDETRVGKIVKKNDWDAKCVDFTDQHFSLMRRKNEVSDRFKADFLDEGNRYLYEKVHTESVGADMTKDAFEKFTNRYLYCIYT